MLPTLVEIEPAVLGTTPHQTSNTRVRHIQSAQHALEALQNFDHPLQLIDVSYWPVARTSYRRLGSRGVRSVHKSFYAHVTSMGLSHH